MLQVFITNNIRIRGASTPLKAAVTKALTISNPIYEQRKKKRQPTYGIEPRIQLFFYENMDIITPRGFEEELCEILKLHGHNADKTIVRRQTEGITQDFGEWASDYQLQPDQIPAVEAILSKRSAVLVAPAGSGKTVMGMNYIYKKSVPALWLAHTTDLLYQAKANAEKFMTGVGKVGVIGDGKKDWGDGKLIVATVQTLQRNPEIIESLKGIIGTVVVDEAHHFPSNAFIEVAGKFPAANMLGVTATPNRKDLMDAYLFRGIGPIAYTITRDGLYESGRLIKPEVKFIFTAFKDREEGAVGNVDAGGEDLDYTALMAKLLKDKNRLRLVAENILDNAANNYSIVLAESVRYCFELQSEVTKLAVERGWNIPRMAVVHGGISKYTWRVARREDGVKPGDDNTRMQGNTLQIKHEQYSDYEMENWQVSAKRRKEIMAQATAKEIDILFATQLAREGLDIPHLNVGHMVTPKRGDSNGSKNGASVEQEIGRIMRPERGNPNKKATWFDYVDYEVGVFKAQYNSRRSVYTRLGLSVPKKKRTEAQSIEDFLNTNNFFDVPPI